MDAVEMERKALVLDRYWHGQYVAIGLYVLVGVMLFVMGVIEVVAAPGHMPQGFWVCGVIGLVAGSVGAGVDYRVRWFRDRVEDRGRNQTNRSEL